MKIRRVQIEDAVQICRIYNYYIENTCISFETEPVSVEEMENRIREIIDEGFPYYAGEVKGKIIGYLYLHPWHVRKAYAATLETSIYLDKDENGKGYGSRLFSHLLNEIDRTKIHVLIAGIYLPNDASVKLHEKFGFRQVSYLKEVGYKFGEWRDVGHWQLIL